MNQQNHPTGQNHFYKGTNYDGDSDISGAEDTGTYIDSKNMRLTDVRSKYGSLKKIDGETIKHIQSTTTSSGTYTCIGACEVRDNICLLYTSPSPRDS